MNKRIITLIICAALFAVLGACSSILDGETLSITDYEEPTIAPTESTIEVNTYEQLKKHMVGFILNYADTGIIRVNSYDGDIHSDVDAACVEIKRDVPIGAYAVSEMIGKVTQIVSYYEVEVHIAYNDVTKEQLDNIIPVYSRLNLQSNLQDMLTLFVPSMTIETENIHLTADEALEYVSQIYYKNPMDIVMMPITTIDFYPDHGTKRIIEFTFGYRYEASTLNVMRNSLNDMVQSIAESVSDSTDSAILLSLGQRLIDVTEYDLETASGGEYSNQNAAATAYGALVNGSAVGEGYAMAYKALCDDFGITCYVVIGSVEDNVHAWNIVKLEGYYYHIDISKSDLNGLQTAFLKNDTEMVNNDYLWDASLYKICNGPLSYEAVIIAFG